jgi:hypothetical protein
MSPKGQVQPDGRIKIAVSFHLDTFVGLCLRADQTGQSFSEVVDECASCGLFDIEESEAHEPVAARR